jgi:hypothetical protein
MASSRAEIFVHVGLLLALCGVLYFPYLGSVPLFDKGEPREALAVQDIVQRGEWLVPLKRATDIPSKPPLFHWSAALAAKLAGSLSEATVRFPSALYATLGILTIYILGREIFDARAALLGGAILATMMLYQDQALSARVDMTLCFFVTLTLTLFYFLYRGVLAHPLWYYLFYALAGLGTLAKGPLGLLLPALVAGAFLVWRGRWDSLKKFAFHPGVVMALALPSAWYAVAILGGGEGFFDRQILEENLQRFVGGSGHSHPVYYYVPYLFFQSMPWGLFVPPLLWDLFRNGFRTNEGALFLKLWFLVMFVFFSISAGKRTVYLLPIYPALSLLLAAWFYGARESIGARLMVYRGIALFAGLTGVLLLIITPGAVWSHDQDWIFSLIEGLLKPKDQANLAIVRQHLDDFGRGFTAVSLLASALWLALTRSLWLGKSRSAAQQMALVAVLQGFINWSVVMPAIAETESYRDFMSEVNDRVKPGEPLYIHGRFNSDAVVFYRGEAIQRIGRPPEEVAPKLGTGNGYLITTEKHWKELQKMAPAAALPLLTSRGRGPEGDASIVLVRADVP